MKFKSQVRNVSHGVSYEIMVIILCLLLDGCFLGDKWRERDPGCLYVIKDSICIHYAPDEMLIYYTLMNEKASLTRFVHDIYPGGCLIEKPSQLEGRYFIDYTLSTHQNSASFVVSNKGTLVVIENDVRKIK